MSASTPSKPSAPLPLRFHNPPLHTDGRPPASSLMSLATVAAGYLIALVGPSLVVSPGATSAPVRRIVLAFALTVVGVVIAVSMSLLAYRRRRNWSWLVVGCVPSIALLAGGAILAGTKAAT